MIKKYFAADVKPNTITVRAHRMERDLMTNVTTEPTIGNDSETEENQTIKQRIRPQRRKLKKKGESKMDQNRSIYELARDLPNPEEMSEEENRRERAQLTLDPEYQSGSKEKVARMSRLCRVGPPAGSALDQELTKQGITREEIQEVSDRGFAEIQMEKTRRQFEKVKDEMAMKFPGLKQDEFGKVVASANTVFNQLRKDGLLAEDFADFVDDSGEGNNPETLKLFSDISKLQGRYAEWREKRAK